MAATVAGAVPLPATALRADTAGFSNLLITTFVDATGLIISLLVARLVLIE